MEKSFERNTSFPFIKSKDRIKDVSDADVVITPLDARKNAFMISFAFEEGASADAVVSIDDTDKALCIEVVHIDHKDDEGKGIGSRIVKALLAAGHSQGRKVRAIRVMQATEGFWLKQGFAKEPEPNPDNNFVYRG